MKILHVSDTHNSQPKLPECDILVHSGDLTILGGEQELMRGIQWLSEQPAKYKILVPGNHDLFLDADHLHGGTNEEIVAMVTDTENMGVSVYTQGSVEVEGIVFGCSSYQPQFMGWGFNVSYQEQLASFSDVLKGQPDVLVTHCPPSYILDINRQNYHCGSTALSEALYSHNTLGWQNNLKMHLFGHIHESNGTKLVKDDFTMLVPGPDGSVDDEIVKKDVLYVNSATCWHMIDYDKDTGTVSIIDKGLIKV